MYINECIRSFSNLYFCFNEVARLPCPPNWKMIVLHGLINPAQHLILRKMGNNLTPLEKDKFAEKKIEV